MKRRDVIEAACKLGISMKAVQTRLARGWGLERALNEPSKVGHGGHRPGAGRKPKPKPVAVRKPPKAKPTVAAKPVPKPVVKRGVRMHPDVPGPSKSALYAMLAGAAANTAKLPRPR